MLAGRQASCRRKSGNMQQGGVLEEWLGLLGGSMIGLILDGLIVSGFDVVCGQTCRIEEEERHPD